MSVIIPELKLSYLEGTNPRRYALNIKIDGQQIHPNLMINHNGSMVTPNSEYLVTVEVGQSSKGSSEIDVDMGQQSFENEESLVKVQLMQGNALIAEGGIRVKEAQQESKPIGGI